MEALWIKRHIESIQPHCENQILHLQVLPSRRFSLERFSTKDFKQIILELPFRSWRVAEYFTTVLLAYHLLRLKASRFDLINFHIAYPLLMHWHILKKIFKVPGVVVTEHWSAYHFNFYVNRQSALQRIRRIFQKNTIPVIAVSKALAEDIRQFSQLNELIVYVVPNVVDAASFYFEGNPSKKMKSVFMLSYWKTPKDPFTVMRAFAKLVRELNNPLKMRIGGYGPLTKEMEEFVIENNLSECIELTGQLDANSIRLEMNEAAMFVHSSGYETFSVVCAEALCCGTPVIASEVGGIPEFVDASNGVLVRDNTESAWKEAMLTAIDINFDRQAIAIKAANRFGIDPVGKLYFKTLVSIYEQYRSVSSHP